MNSSLLSRNIFGLNKPKVWHTHLCLDPCCLAPQINFLSHLKLKYWLVHKYKQEQQKADGQNVGPGMKTALKELEDTL